MFARTPIRATLKKFSNRKTNSGYGYSLFLDSNNGTEKWTYNIGPTWASPTVGEDGIIYVPATDHWNVFAFYPNGTVKWKFHANEKIHVSDTNFHHLSDSGIDFCNACRKAGKAMERAAFSAGNLTRGIDVIDCLH